MSHSIQVWKKFPFRILETVDPHYRVEDLKGDLFKPELITEMGYAGTVEDLAREELEFEDEINREGVYGYELQLWNPFIQGSVKWQHVDSCWGFVGQYVDSKKHKYCHYIVAEMKATAKKLSKKTA